MDKFQKVYYSDELVNNSLFELLDGISEESLQKQISSYRNFLKIEIPLSENYTELLNRYPLISVDFHENEDLNFDQIKNVAIVKKISTKERMEIHDVIDFETGQITKLNESDSAPDLFLIKFSEKNIKIDKGGKLELHESVMNPDVNDETVKLFSTNYFDVYSSFHNVYFSLNSYTDDSKLNRSSCLRDLRNTSEYISKMRLQNNGVYSNLNSWTEGRYFEFSFTVGGVNYNSANQTFTSDWVTKNRTIKKKNFKDGNWNFLAQVQGQSGLYFFNWDPSLSGDKVKYTIIEKDGHQAQIDHKICIPPVNYKINESWSIGSGQSYCITIKRDNSDYELGQTIVNYCDNSAWPGHWYGTGDTQLFIGD